MERYSDLGVSSLLIERESRKMYWSLHTLGTACLGMGNVLASFSQVLY